MHSYLLAGVGLGESYVEGMDAAHNLVGAVGVATLEAKTS